MVLESTMICLDNSDWMRNGDYVPSRVEAQKDAAGVICNDRVGSNPENTVGILSMAGKGVDLLVSPTEDAGKILACFARVTVGGKCDIGTAVQIAQLALKHRKNKNGGQRIIVFVGGPVIESVEALKKIGKQLKKNNVAIDVISLGETEENQEKLTEFVNATNSNDNSHLITVPSGVNPVEAISYSPVMHMGGGGGGAAMGSGGGDGGFDMYNGIDPAMDPELAMAIRISTEEARAQDEARLKAAQEQGGETQQSSSSSAGFGGPGAIDEDDEDALMQKALEMSMREMGVDPNEAAAAAAAAGGKPEPMETDGDEDEDLKLALAMSTGGGSEGFVDPNFVNELLGQVDQSDPLVQAALEQLNAANNNEKNEEKDESANKKHKGNDDK